MSYTEGLVDTEIFDTQKNITAESFQSLALGYGYESLLGPCEIKFAQGHKPGEIRVFGIGISLLVLNCFISPD